VYGFLILFIILNLQAHPQKEVQKETLRFLKRPASFSYMMSCQSGTFTIPSPTCNTESYTSIFWSFGDPSSGSQNTSTLSSVVHFFTSSGSYLVKLILNSTCGVDSIMETITISTPTVTLTGDSILCSGKSANLIANGAVTYTWSDGTTNSSLSVSPNSTSTYTVTGSNKIGCISKAYTTLRVMPLPILSVTGPEAICKGESSLLTASGTYFYTWNTGSTSDTIFVKPTISTVYAVSGEDLNGCINSTTVQIIIKPDSICTRKEINCYEGDLSLPNAFSPNGDGHNDAFCLQGWDLCIDYFTILIFDRWGEKVFESTNPSFCWDGTFNGKVLETDVIVYTLTASFANGSRVDKKGNITLLR